MINHQDLPPLKNKSPSLLKNKRKSPDPETRRRKGLIPNHKIRTKRKAKKIKNPRSTKINQEKKTKRRRRTDPGPETKENPKINQSRTKIEANLKTQNQTKMGSPKSLFLNLI